MESERNQRCIDDPEFAVKVAFESTTGKSVSFIDGSESLPTDHLGFWNRLDRFQKVLQIDIETAETLNDLIRVLKIKRAYPHTLE